MSPGFFVRMKFNGFVGISNNIKTVVKMGTIVVALFYFIYHAISGENGFLSYVKTKKLILENQLILDKLEQEFKVIERNVKLLSSENLDLDLLEERCRTILNLSKKDEYIILERAKNS